MLITCRIFFRVKEISWVPSRTISVDGNKKELSGRFIPSHKKVDQTDVESLSNFILSANGKLLVITGAGISTESDLPDYRSGKIRLFFIE